jgi:hypothetical protein
MDSLFGLDRPHDEEGMELLTTARDEVELSVLRSILDGEEIPYLAKDRGSGALVRIITGNSMYGTDILVPTAYLAQATEILDAYRNAEPVDEDWEDEDEEEDET